MGVRVMPSEVKERTVTVECDMSEPALTGAAFDLIRTLAAAHGLERVAHISINMQLEFSGLATEQQITVFDSRLDQLWLGAVVKREA